MKNILFRTAFMIAAVSIMTLSVSCKKDEARDCNRGNSGLATLSETNDVVSSVKYISCDTVTYLDDPGEFGFGPMDPVVCKLILLQHGYRPGNTVSISIKQDGNKNVFYFGYYTSELPKKLHSFASTDIGEVAHWMERMKEENGITEFVVRYDKETGVWFCWYNDSEE